MTECSCCQANISLNETFIKVHCCHIHKMILTTSTQDSKDQNLSYTYQELAKSVVPYKRYKPELNYVSIELNTRIDEIQEVIKQLRKGKIIYSRNAHILSRVREVCTLQTRFVLPSIFEPTYEDLKKIMKDLPYFGFIWGVNVEVADLFLFDVCICLYKYYTDDKNFTNDIFKDMNNIDKRLNKNIFDRIIADVILIISS